MVSLSQLKQFVDLTIVANAANTSIEPHQHQHDELVELLISEGPHAASNQFNENINTLTKSSSTDAAIRIKGASVRLMAIWFDTLRAKLQQALLRPTDLFNEFSSNPNEDNLAVFMDAFLEFNQEMDQLLSVGGEEENGNSHATNSSRIGPVGNPFEINDRLLDLYKMAIGSAIGAVQVETVKNFKAVSDAVVHSTDDQPNHRQHNDRRVSEDNHHDYTSPDEESRQQKKHQHVATSKKTAFGGINFSQVGERSPPPHADNDSEFHSLPRDRDILEEEEYNNHNTHRNYHGDNGDLVRRSFPSKNEYDDVSSEYNLRFGTHHKQRQDVTDNNTQQRHHVDPIRVNLQRSIPTRNPQAASSSSFQSRHHPDTVSVAASDDPGVAEHIQHTKRKKFAIAEKVGGAAPPSINEERLQASRSSRIEAQRNAAKGGTPARSASAGVGVGGGGGATRVGRASSSSATNNSGGMRAHQYGVADAMRHDVSHDLPIRGRAGKQYKSSDPNSIANVSNEDYYNNSRTHHADVNVSASSINTTGSCVSTSHAERMQEEKRRKILEYERSVDKQRNDYFQHLQKERIIPTPAADSTSSSHQQNILSSMFDSRGPPKQPPGGHQPPNSAHTKGQYSLHANNDEDTDDSVHRHTDPIQRYDQTNASYHQQGNMRKSSSEGVEDIASVGGTPFQYQEPLHRQLPSPRVNPDADRPNSRRPPPNKRESPIMAPNQTTSTPQQDLRTNEPTQKYQSSHQPPVSTTETSKMTQLRIEMASLKKQLSASQSGGASGSQEIQYYAIHKRMQRVRAEMIQEQRDIDAVAHMEEDRKSLQRDLQAKRKQFKR